MSEIERAIVTFIAEFCNEHGYSPSFRDICDAVDRSEATIHSRIAALVARGELTMVPGQPRTVRVPVISGGAA